MVVFAWILWSIYVLGFTILTAIAVASVAALNDGREVELKINFFTFLMNVAVFVFLNLYLFMK